MKATHSDLRLTIGQHLEYVLPRLSFDPTIPIWPPDVFAICASALVKSGGYCRVLVNWPPKTYRAPEDWDKAAVKHGRSWRRMWVTKRTAPKAVARYWGTLIDARDKPVQAIAENATLGQAVLQLCAVADEASEGVGSPLDGHETEIEERFQFHASGLLDRDSPGSSLCEEINVTRLRVLPKMHTPQTGLTVRSLSHYLALCEPSEVVPYWIQSMSPLRDDSMNLLVVPWPFEIYPVQFRAAVPLQNEMRNMPDRFGFFTFDQRDSGDVVEAVSKLYDSALEQVGRIDGVVLPELALTEQERIDLRSFALQKNAFLVSGFGSSSQGGTRCGENQVGLDFRGVLDVTLSQRKHHRWKLDSSQVSQYRLGSLLYPEKEWWEHINIEPRCFLFVSLHAAIVLSILICEDLARPDPVGNLVRAVGPNLVIALLMDGPQLKERWAGRFATTLADDPGCSVLSVTSLGMSKLSRPRDGAGKSQVVALWKDAKSGGPIEISLDEGAEAVVLSLSMRYLEEWSADGRSDGANAAYPILSSIHCVRQSTNAI